MTTETKQLLTGRSSLPHCPANGHSGRQKVWGYWVEKSFTEDTGIEVSCDCEEVKNEVDLTENNEVKFALVEAGNTAYGGHYEVSHCDKDKALVYQQSGGRHSIERKEGTWQVSLLDVPVLRNSSDSDSEIPPVLGWESKTCQTEVSITLSEKPLLPCKTVVISASEEATTEYPEGLGEYTATGAYSNGRPVFRGGTGGNMELRSVTNSEEGLVWKVWKLEMDKSGWKVPSPALIQTIMEGQSSNPLCPSNIKHVWSFWSIRGRHEGLKDISLAVSCDCQLDYLTSVKSLLELNAKIPSLFTGLARVESHYEVSVSHGTRMMHLTHCDLDVLKPLLKAILSRGHSSKGPNLVNSVVRENNTVDLALLKTLLQAGLDPLTEDSNGLSSLLIVIQCKNIDSFKIIVQMGVKLTDVKIQVSQAGNNFEILVLHKDIKMQLPSCDLAFLRQLLQSGVTHEPNSAGISLCYTALTQKSPALLETLLEVGLSLEVQHHDGSSPLHMAVQHDNTSCLEVLLREKTANLNLQDHNGSSPLHTAAQHNSIACLEVLLKISDVDLDATDRHGRTPCQVASYNVNKECAKMFDLFGVTNRVTKVGIKDWRTDSTYWSDRISYQDHGLVTGVKMMIWSMGICKIRMRYGSEWGEWRRTGHRQEGGEEETLLLEAGEEIIGVTTWCKNNGYLVGLQLRTSRGREKKYGLWLKRCDSGDVARLAYCSGRDGKWRGQSLNFHWLDIGGPNCRRC